MKRFAAFLLTLLLVFTLCSCGKKHVEEQTVPPAVEDQTGEQQPEVKPAPQPVKPEVKPDDAEDETVVTAPVTPVVKPAEEVKPQGGTSGGGHHSGGSTVKNLTITEEKTVKGGKYNTVTIAASVGNGTVTLDGVTIQNELIVQGGGSNSIKVKNSTVPTVVLDKDTGADAEAPRLELTGTQVGTVEVAKPAIIEATDAVSKVDDLSAKDDVTIKGKETIVQNVTVPTEAKENVKLTVNDAAVEKVDVNKAVTIETNAAMGKTPVQNVEAKANVTVTGAATNVGKVTVPEETKNAVKLTVTDAKVAEVSAAKPVTIEANEKASKIEKVEAKDKVTVQGDTKIDKVEAKADVTVAGEQTKINTITVPKEAEKAPKIDVTAGSVNTVDVKAEVGAAVSGGEDTIANVEAAAPVTVDSKAVAKVTVVSVKVSVTVNGDSTGTSTVEVAVEVKTTGNETVAIVTNNNVTVNVSTSKEETPAVKLNNEEVAHIHKWVESGREEAKCTTPGSASYKCTTCGATKAETIPAKGHVEVVLPAVEPTCTAGGKTAGKVCADCGAELVTQTDVDPLGHSYGKWVSDETGHWKVCPRCGEIDQKAAHTYNTQNCEEAASCTVCGYVKKAGTHTWKVSEKTEPSCTAAGSVRYTCASCSATRTETLAALGHIYGTPTYKWNDTSCTATRSCTRDGCTYAETETVAGMKNKDTSKEPTCTEDGVTVYIATFENAAFTSQTKQVKAEKADHVLTQVAAKAATCETAGNNEYWICSVCKQAFSNEQGTEKTTVASQTNMPLGHAYGNVTYEWDGDSCTATRACTHDATHKLTETKTGTYVKDTDATCTANEKGHYTVTFNDTQFGSATTEANSYEKPGSARGHSFSAAWSKDDTYHWHAATCGHTGEVSGKAAHSWDDGVVTTAPTCTEKGVKTFTCTVCSATKTEEVAALGHTYGTPTYTWNGNRCTAKHVCTRSNCTHEETETVTAVESVTQENTCILDKLSTYTATFTNSAFEAQTQTNVKTADKLGHQLTKTDAKAATCEEAGNNEYWSCSRCNKYFSDAQGTTEIAANSWVINATGHSFSENWTHDDTYHWHAATCGHTEEVSGKATHSWNSGEVTTAPTCTEKGVKTFTCTVCSATKTEEVAVVAHKGSEVNGKAATCEADGWKDFYQCSVCHKLFSDETYENEITLDAWKAGDGKLPAGHTLTKTDAKAATYTENGNNAYWTCSVCQKVFSDEAGTTETTVEAQTLPATPFKVGANTYATYAEALDAAHEAGLKDEELFNLTYKVYPTIEIYGSCTVEGNLHLATATSIVVKNGGSLTVGTLTMEPGTMNGWWLDAGTLRLEQGSSFSLGGVQYTGTNGAFAMGDDKSYIELAGRAPDMKGNDYVAVFNGNITQQNTFAMDRSYMFFNEQNSVLTVKGTLTNNAYVDNRGTIIIDGGTLTNNGTIDNESDIAKAMGVTGQINILSNGKLTNEASANITSGKIAAFGSTVTNAGTIDNKKTIEMYGGTLTNSGEIVGVYEMNDIGFEDWSTYVSIEKGATLNNTGTITDLINVADYYYTSSEPIRYTYDDTVGTLGEKARVEKVAAVFDLSQLQTVLNDGSYVNVIVSGTSDQNTVELGGVTVPRGQRLVLKSSVFDGTNTYHNSYKVSSGVLTVVGKEENVKDGPKGELVTVGAPSVTVAKGGKILTYGFAAFDKLTVNGHVDCEADMLLVAQNLTIGAEGTLEIGGEGEFVYSGGEDGLTISGKLLATTRYMNGLSDGCIFKQSHIEGVESTATLTTLVINRDAKIYGKHYVDAVVLADSGNLQLFTGSTLSYKALYAPNGDKILTAPEAWNVTGPDEADYYTVTGGYEATVVDSVNKLENALEEGGEIYLLPFDKSTITPDVWEGETVYESQYHINKILTNSPFALTKDIQLIGICGKEEIIAVFFDDGFDLAANKTLRFDGLNVVAAADSTVGGTVEAHNGVLIVQGKSGGATLTNNGTIQIGSEEVWGQFAIFDESKPNKIVNNGTIESYGELKFDWNPDRDLKQFEGDDPIEYATFRDLVCELQQGFGNLPNLEHISIKENNELDPNDLYWLYEKYHADGQELERNKDYDAIGAFAWLIKNNIISNTPASGTNLNPWHYMTYNEVSGLFNKFATKVLGTTTDLDIATGTDLADKNFCFGKLHDALGSLSKATVTTEQALREALDAPYVTEIRITGNIELNSNIDLQPAGDGREIFVEPNVTLTVPQDIQMDIKQNVKLVVVCDNKTNTRGQLIVNGNVNVFGELEPDENDESRITVDWDNGGNISYFGDAYFFGEKLLEVAGEYMNVEGSSISEDYKKLDDWDDNEKITCLVAYGLQPESDENGSWWNFGATPEYGQMLSILTNVYRVAVDDDKAVLPKTVKAGDKDWTPDDSDCLDNRSVEELLGKFALVLPKLNDTDTDSFVIQHTNSEDNTDGKTIIGKTFTNAITVTAVKTNNNFAGELNFVNCTFSGGIKLVYNPYCDYRVNFNDSCTGAVTTVYSGDATGGDQRIRIAHPNGMTITANALTAFEMNDGCLCNTDSFTVNGLTINGNGCKNLEVDVRTNDTTPTIEVTGSEDGSAIELSGSYTGKLRVSGCMDVSRVIMGTDSMLELCNEPQQSNIALGNNRINVNNDCGGDYHFTGSGEVYVPGGNSNARITVNGRNLANPHVFGNGGSYGIFLGLADTGGMEFEVKQGNQVLKGYSPRVIEETGGNKKTHLESAASTSDLWINYPGDITLTVRVEDGCMVVYDKLWYKDAQVVDQGQTG